jgi:hypothetical protein
MLDPPVSGGGVVRNESRTASNAPAVRRSAWFGWRKIGARPLGDCHWAASPRSRLESLVTGSVER